MSDNDLTRLLADWPYEPARINARLFEAADGRALLQLRLQLGVLQLELEGRPDGARPQGFDSLLAWHSNRLQRYVTANGGAAGFILTAAECRDLREEVMMVGHRAMALFALEQFERVVHDTRRNLKILDLIRDFAANDADRTAIEHLRPHILTMRCRALASGAIRTSNPRAALEVIDEGLQQVMQALTEMGFGDRLEQSNDVQLLRGMRDALVPKLPGSQRVELRDRLRMALEAENYELASILRDELRMME